MVWSGKCTNNDYRACLVCGGFPFFLSRADGLFHLALALESLLSGEAAVLLVLGLDLAGGLVSDAEALDEVLVAGDVLPEEEVQKAAALVDEGDEAPPGGEVLGVGPEVLGEVGDALGHAGDLVFRAAAVGVVQSVLGPQFGEALIVEEAVESALGVVVGDVDLGGAVVEVAGVDDEVLDLLLHVPEGGHQLLLRGGNNGSRTRHGRRGDRGERLGGQKARRGGNYSKDRALGEGHGWVGLSSLLSDD